LSGIDPTTDFAGRAREPLVDDNTVRRVEICMMKHTVPEVETKCATAILANTDWPFRFVAYDNRLNQPNTAKMWNKFVREATCPYVCIIDSDAFVPRLSPCWLTRMMSAFATTECDVMLAAANSCGNRQQKRSGPAADGTVERIDTPWSSFVFLFRKDLPTRYGAFDEDFLAYGPDTEFATRLKLAGGKAYACLDVWLHHVHGATHKLRPEREAERPFATALYREKKLALQNRMGESQ
jgi:hypothetical protein